MTITDVLQVLCECGHLKDQHEQKRGDCRGGYCGCYEFKELER